MKLSFTKMQGCANDYIYLDCRTSGVPEDIARTALFLCDEENSFINGETITVDGGMTKLMVYHNDCGWKYRPEE